MLHFSHPSSCIFRKMSKKVLRITSTISKHCFFSNKRFFSFISIFNRFSFRFQRNFVQLIKKCPITATVIIIRFNWISRNGTYCNLTKIINLFYVPTKNDYMKRRNVDYLVIHTSRSFIHKSQLDIMVDLCLLNSAWGRAIWLRRQVEWKFLSTGAACG